MKNSDCLRTSIAVMQVTGVWLPDRFSTYPYNLYYAVFGIGLQGLIFVSVVLAEISYVVLALGNTEKTVDAAVLLLSHLVQGVKVMTIWKRQDRIKELINTIDGPKFNRHRDPTKKAMVENSTRMTAAVGNVILLSAGVTAGFWCMVPMLNPDLTLPLRTAYPFDINVSPMFEIMYAYSSASVCLVGVGDAAENFLVSGLVILAGVQLDVLCQELVDLEADDSGMAYEHAVAFVKYHQDIIKFVEELASIFGVALFFQFITSSVVLCMAVFKITLSTEPIEITTMAFYIICVFIEILMYCYPGDLLLNKSLAVSEAVYSCNWVRASPAVRRVLLLTSLRAQRALGISAGGMFRVSLPGAAAVVQTSYSYYAMLKQTHNE